MLPLPRVGGALSGALPRSIAEAGAGVNARPVIVLYGGHRLVALRR